ncbi:hypothetical protein L1987_54173 [Smallanthus sonchifolius]|uniref:Uncharacterized protein n=1 Tax=Smallanthus sonchifolius TaxID=185202 RepID=A0ACB9E6S5_9ASTR|nr:hypothetical protein L1987_54173 [Smallanthus sonchifolius]
MQFDVFFSMFYVGGCFVYICFLQLYLSCRSLNFEDMFETSLSLFSPYESIWDGLNLWPVGFCSSASFETGPIYTIVHYETLTLDLKGRASFYTTSGVN